MGWLADRSVPRPLRRLVYGTYCRITGADPDEAQLAIDAYPSLGAFFVRRLKPGARELPRDPLALACPCDGRVQALGRVEAGRLVQAKGRHYALEELLGGIDPRPLEGGWCWTLYLAPSDYHRVHVPTASRLTRVGWIPGDLRSVAPGVLARHERVLSTNQRAVLGLDSPAGSYHLVMVGALNVGRIRVVGVQPGASPASALPLERGAELARFEMGSTVVLVTPPGMVRPDPGIGPGSRVLLHQSLGTVRG